MPLNQKSCCNLLAIEWALARAFTEFAGCAPSTRIKLPVRGRGVQAALHASPLSFDFGDVPTHQWADQLCVLTNTSATLAAAWSAPKDNPYFEIIPASGKILGGQTQQVMVRYAPKALGRHKGALPIVVMGTAQGGAGGWIVGVRCR